MKRFTFLILAYLALGVAASVGQYFLTNPSLSEPCPSYVAEFKCSSIPERILEIISRSDFYITLPIWPFRFISGTLFAN